MMNLGLGYREVFVEAMSVGMRGAWQGVHENEHVMGPVRCWWSIGEWKGAGELWAIDEVSEMS